MPDNYSPDLRVFPAKEMMAVDMAYALDALALGNGIVHGCQVANTNGALTITSGRIMIKGRLAYIQGGNIPLPSDSGTYHLLAICNLQAPEPFELRLCSDSEKADLDALVANTIDTEFNNADGVRYIKLGTAVVDSAQGVVTSYTASTTYGVPRNNATIYEAKMTDLAHTLGDHQSHLSWLDRRRWSKSKIVTRNVVYPFVTVQPNSREGVTINLSYGTTYEASISGGIATVVEHPNYEDQPIGVPDAYGRVLDTDDRHRLIGVSGITFGSPTVGTAQAVSKCVLAGWSINTTPTTEGRVHNGYVYIYNTSNTVAQLSVTVRGLYALYE